MDVRDALAQGKQTAIVPTGGVEPNGPWLATGKHNFILRTNCDAIARELGDALCAPVLPFVPEGGFFPRTGHMRSPGTISLEQQTYEAVLTDVARSLAAHGFENIIFIGDSGGNQSGQRNVASRLSEEWGGSPVVAHVRAYYDYAGVRRHMETEHGLEAGESDGLHDDPIIALNMFADDPASVRWAERLDAGLAEIDGVSLADRVRNLELAHKIVAFRAATTAAATRAAIANGGTLAPPDPAARPQPPRPPVRPAPPVLRPEPDGRDMGGGRCAANKYNCADEPNPLPPVNTLWIEEMTWMDVRDALQKGKTTAIIPTGGVEPNGPWLVTGKHNHVLRANCPRIAAELGDALCAPIVKWVPEGGHDPKTGHMRSPGTISLTQETFRALLTDIARSLKAHGFTEIVFIGDSGGNQAGQERVAEALNAEWDGSARAHHVIEYYRAPEGSRNILAERGLAPDPRESDGLHDDPVITLNMMLSSLASVRWHERTAARQASIDGFPLQDLEQSLALAREISQARAERTAAAIERRIADAG